MTTPDLQKLRQRLLGRDTAARPTSYAPLPGYASPSSGFLHEAWAAFQRRFSLVFRFFAWARTTAAPPDTRMGRIAAWADATGDRFMGYGLWVGPLIGVVVACVNWYVTTRADPSDLPGRVVGGAFAGLVFAFFANIYVFGILQFLASYWKWVVGYAALLAGMFLIGTVFPKT